MAVIYKKLGEIADISAGGTPKRSNPTYWKNGNIPWVKISDIKGKYLEKTEEFITEDGLNNSAKLFKKGTLLYTIFATIGECAILNINASTNQAIAGINVKSEKVLTEYLYYFLKSIKNTVVNTGRGVAQNNINLSILKNIDVPLPEIEVQKKIINLLNKSNELVIKRKSQIEALDQLTQSVFLEMFGDPINTKWKTEKLSEITDVRDGTHDSPKYIQKGYPLVTSKNIKDGEIDLTNVNYISEEDYEKINQRSKVDIGDIIMPMIGTIGNPVIVNVEPNFAIKNVALIKFYPDTCIINIYLKYLLDSHYLDFVLSKNRRGGTQKFLSLKNIRNMEIPVPPIKLQKDFTKVIREINEKKKLLNKSLDEMVNAYNSIMQRAFKGELFTEDKVPNH